MLVVGVTEICRRGCYYCPNPPQRTDTSYAGDLVVEEDQDLIREARLIDAQAACITGGEPLMKLERAIRFIRTLKQGMGPAFHLHLYTCVADVSPKTLKALFDAGLDEIRFHLHGPHETSGLSHALELPWRVGVEIPCIPSPPGCVPEIVHMAREHGVALINLNEFHMAPSNYDKLLKRGFHAAEPIPESMDGVPVTPRMREAMLSDLRFVSKTQVVGSRELAMELLGESQSWPEGSPWLHFCSSQSKFSVQKTNRDRRRAAAVARSCDEVTDSGRLLFGRIICGTEDTTQEVMAHIMGTRAVDSRSVRRSGTVIELPWFVAGRMKKELAREWPEVTIMIREESSYERQRDP